MIAHSPENHNIFYGRFKNSIHQVRLSEIFSSMNFLSIDSINTPVASSDLPVARGWEWGDWWLVIWPPPSQPPVHTFRKADIAICEYIVSPLTACSQLLTSVIKLVLHFSNWQPQPGPGTARCKSRAPEAWSRPRPWAVCECEGWVLYRARPPPTLHQLDSCPCSRPHISTCLKWLQRYREQKKSLLTLELLSLISY